MLLIWIVLSQLRKVKSQIFISTQEHVINVMSNYRKTVWYELQAKSVVFFIRTSRTLLRLDITISSSSRMIVDDCIVFYFIQFQQVRRSSNRTDNKLLRLDITISSSSRMIVDDCIVLYFILFSSNRSEDPVTGLIINYFV